MTSYDVLLQDISGRMGALPRRWVVAIFLACSSALRPALLAWGDRRDVDFSDLVREAERAAQRFALEGIAMGTLLADPGMRRALDFVDEAIASVTTDAPTAADVARLAQLAQAIAP